MKTLKRMFLIIAILSAVAVAMMHTITLFSGQHSWYDLDAGIPCSKCHADICEELSVSGVHRNLSCAACHRCNLTDYTYASGDGIGPIPGKEAHAASTVPCMECHEVNIWGPYAGGFTNKTNSTYQYADATHNGTKAAHNVFVQGAVNETLMEDSNEACIACHTVTPVNISFTVSTEATITVNNVYNESYSYWDVTEITSSNSTPYKGVKE